MENQQVTLKKDNSMKTARRMFLARIMNEAWALARQGARKFGGSAKLYLAIALRLVWQDSRPRTVWHRGLGNQFVLPGMPQLTVSVKKGQFFLPGIAN